MEEKQFIFAGWMIDGSGGPVQGHVLLGIEDGFITDIENGSNIKKM